MVAEAAVSLDSLDSAAASQERLLVEFELDGECYGVDIGSIREIIRYQQVTVLPGAPDIVEGIINLRGRVTPIVDLRTRLGLNTSEVDDTTRIIVIDVDDALVGVQVDAVTGVISLTGDQLQPLSGEVTTNRSNYLEGVADIDGRLVVLINLQGALEDDIGHMATPPDAPAPAEAPATTSEAPPPTAEAPPAAAPVETPEAPAASEDEAPAAATPADPSEVIETPEVAPGPPPTDGAMDLGLQVDLLEQSFEAMKPRAEELVGRFYANLFEQHPTIQSLFAGVDIAEQQGELLSALTTVITSLQQPNVLIPHLEELGRRYVAYGVEPAHYEAFGTVLVETLGEIAGELWTDELRDAWSDAVTLAATVMLDGASQVEAPTAAPPVEIEPPVAAPSTEDTKPAPAQSADKNTASKKPATKKPAAKKPATKKPAAKKPATRKPAAKPSAKKVAAKKITAKRPAAGKPATRKAAAAS